MNSKWQRAGQQVKPGLKIVGKLALLTALVNSGYWYFND